MGSGSTGRAGLGDNGHLREAAGTGGSAGQKNRGTRRLRARVTGKARRTTEVESRARDDSRQGVWRECECNENEPPPP